VKSGLEIRDRCTDHRTTFRIVELSERLDHLTRDRANLHQLLPSLREAKRVLLCSHTFLPDKLYSAAFIALRSCRA
jgi:hypothetical protein